MQQMKEQGKNPPDQTNEEEVGSLPENNSELDSLVVQWLRICLPMQGTQVRALVRKIPHAAEQLSPCTTTTEPVL